MPVRPTRPVSYDRSKDLTEALEQNVVLVPGPDRDAQLVCEPTSGLVKAPHEDAAIGKRREDALRRRFGSDPNEVGLAWRGRNARKRVERIRNASPLASHMLDDSL